MAREAELSLVLNAINRATGPLKDVGKSLDKLEGNSKNLLNRLGPLNKALGVGIAAATGLAVAGVTALAGVVGSSIKEAADFEQGLVDIAAAMGASADETAGLKKLIIDLGFDPKLKVSAQEAADAIKKLGTSGVSVDQIIQGAAKSAILLANATGADMADAAAIATDAMGQFGIEVKDLDKAVNGITSTTINSKFDINDYGLALAQAGGIAATVGVEFDDFNTTIAAISPYFASGSDAGTSFKTMLLSLIPKSQDAEDAMKELGLMTAEGANQFFNSSGEMKSMGEISGILNKALSGLSEEQKNEALATIFGTDAMRAAAAMSGFTEEAFGSLQATMAKTDATEQAAKRMDTLSGVMEIMWGVVDSLKLQIGDRFLPVVRRMAEMFTEQASIHGPALVEMFGKLADKLAVALESFLPWVVTNLPLMIAQVPVVVKHIGEFVAQFVKVATEVFNAVVPVVSFIAGLTNLKGWLITIGALVGVTMVANLVLMVAGIVSAITAIGGFVASIVGVAIPALGAFLVAAGPIILIVAAIVAAVVALKVAWDNNFLGIRDRTQQIFDWLKSVFQGFPATIESMKTKLAEWGTSAMTFLKNGLSTVSGVFSYLRGWFTDFPGSIEHLKGQFHTWGSTAMGKLREGLVSAQNAVRNGLDVVMDFLKRGGEERLPGWQQQLYNGGSLAIQKLGEGLNAMREWTKGQLVAVLSDVKEHGWGYAAGAFAGRMVESARNILTKFGEGFQANAPGASQALINVLVSVGNSFNSVMDNFRNHAFASASAVLGKLRDGFASLNLGTAIGSTLTGMINGFNGIMDGFRNHVYASAHAVLGKIRDGLATINLGSAIQTALSGMINGFNGIMDGFKNHVYGGASAVGIRIMEGLKAINLGGTMGTVLNSIIATFNDSMDRFRTHVWAVMSGIGGRIADGLRDGLNAGMDRIRSAIASLINLVPAYFREQLGINSPSTVFMEIGSQLMQGLVVGMEKMAVEPQGVLNGLGANLNASLNGMQLSGASSGGSGNVDQSRNTNNSFAINMPGGTSTQPGDERLGSLVNNLSALYAR